MDDTDLSRLSIRKRKENKAYCNKFWGKFDYNTILVDDSLLRQAQDIGQYFKCRTEILYTKARSNDKR
jgi:hypothetical protein